MSQIDDLQAAVDSVRAEILRLKFLLREWVPYPRNLTGWDDPECPEEAAEDIRQSCEVHGIAVPKHVQLQVQDGG